MASRKQSIRIGLRKALPFQSQALPSHPGSRTDGWWLRIQYVAMGTGQGKFFDSVSTGAQGKDGKDVGRGGG